MPDDRLSLAVTHADGRVTKWGPDCPDGQDIPGDLTLTDSIPGGHGTLTTSLLRRIDVQQADEALFDAVRCYGPGGQTAWDGLMAQFPRTHGDGFGVSPGAVGWSSVLRWDTGFREIYVDRDPGSWGPPPLNERIRLAAAAYDQASLSWQAGDGMVAALPNQALGANVTASLWYQAPAGVTVAKIGYQGTNTSIPAGWAAARFIFNAADAFGVSEIVAATLDNTLRTATPITPRRYVFTDIDSSGTAATPAAGALRRIDKIASYGNHGLTLRTISGEPSGLYASDVLADVIARAAPQLTANIDPTVFAIPHLVYSEPVTAEFAISDINKYHLYDWGVFDDREFFFRAPDPERLLWRARLSDGAHLDADGDTAEQVINGVFVTYTDATGIQKTVGPPGGPFDATDSTLEDTTSTNQANAHGLGRKWVQLSLSFPTTLAGATAIGFVYLAERSLAGRRGSITLTGTATHPTEGKVPCWRVRSGDWITLKDLNGSMVPRKIISKTYTHSTRQVRLDLDNTVAKLDAIMARVGIQAGIATGGGF